MNKLAKNIWDVLFPPACIRCGSEGAWLCSFCRKVLPLSLVRWCPACCRTVTPEHRMNRHGLLFDECWSLLSYHEPWVERAVHAVKFDGLSSYAGVLGAELAERWRDPNRVAEEYQFRGVERHSTIITAIPLSKKRERERGFNQAERIARSLCEHSNIPYEHLLERKKVTKAQAKLSADERLENVADAFHISAPPRGRGISRLVITKWKDGRDPASRWPTPRHLGMPSTRSVIHGKTIILIDDVVTTGATLSEAARTLRQAGAGHIICVTVAYAVLEHTR